MPFGCVRVVVWVREGRRSGAGWLLVGCVRVVVRVREGFRLGAGCR